METKRFSFVRENEVERIYLDKGNDRYVSTGRGDNDDYKDSTETINMSDGFFD